MSISEVNSNCTRWLMSVQNLVEAKRLCKNILRLNRATFHKMTACRIFTVDASLVQAFNNLEVEYIFIILQIALKHSD
ncbi:hypothetical protein HF086_006424 [Spodoptera exigua]|uniref:Uncharacterized protein n=1 Tax=Spodoptera exigua TaxID=7107 RepID=A0A922MX83_SPOEX|nr:hypothetical protein HF086_006424 [Spodoptera exigua]